jgi:hypothetical protein
MIWSLKAQILNLKINQYYRDEKNIQVHYQKIQGQLERHSINIAS